MDIQARLQATIAMNKTKLVKILAEGGIDVNKKFRSGLTPIVTACIENNAMIVRILLDNGADLTARDSLGRTVFHYAYMSENPDIIKFLEEYRRSKQTKRVSDKYAFKTWNSKRRVLNIPIKNDYQLSVLCSITHEDEHSLVIEMMKQPIKSRKKIG